MRYEIIEVIVRDKRIVGYRLRDSYGNASNYSKEQVFKLAWQGSIMNATYNKYRKGLDGAKGVNLSTLKRVQYAGKLGQSNHELADLYNAKLRLLSMEEV